MISMYMFRHFSYTLFNVSNLSNFPQQNRGLSFHVLVNFTARYFDYICTLLLKSERKKKKNCYFFFTSSLPLENIIQVLSFQPQDILKAAGDFIHKDLKMDYVYDYMFHVFNEYSKLMRYKPTKPERAIEICSEILACRSMGLYNKFMKESMVKGPADMMPCNMPPPYDDIALRTLLTSKTNSISLVESWEKRYWENQTKHD